MKSKDEKRSLDVKNRRTKYVPPKEVVGCAKCGSKETDKRRIYKKYAARKRIYMYEEDECRNCGGITTREWLWRKVNIDSEKR
jgi:RNA polymerase subunit RPABC4/transcription elongation factor Spt4